MSENTIPPLKLNSYTRYDAHVCKRFGDEYFWGCDSWEMETYAEALNYIHRVFPDIPPERYRIVEVTVTRKEVTQ